MSAERKSTRGAELMGLVAFALSLMLLIALATFDPRDPAPFFKAGAEGPARNFIGPFGAVLAEISLEEERDEELTASQKLRQSLSVPRARKARPVAAFVVSTAGVLLLLSAAAWEKGCLGSRAGAASAAPAPASAPAR